MKPTDYEAVRVGMNVSQAIMNGTIDAGIGLENVQQCELEEWLKAQGVSPLLFTIWCTPCSSLWCIAAPCDGCQDAPYRPARGAWMLLLLLRMERFEVV